MEKLSIMVAEMEDGGEGRGRGTGQNQAHVEGTEKGVTWDRLKTSV